MSSQDNTDKPVPQLPEENTTEQGTKPSPSTSSPATRRLSVLINKAKKSISQAADKVSSPTESTHAKSSEPATTTDNAGTSNEPAAANQTAEATSDGAEKRRSRLVENFENFFHRNKVSNNARTRLWSILTDYMYIYRPQLRNKVKMSILMKDMVMT